MAKEFTFDLKRFGGLDDSPGTDSVLSPDTVNFDITDEGRLKKRDGFVTVGRLNGKIRALWNGELNGEEHFVAVGGVRVFHSLSGWDDLELIGTLPGSLEAQIIPFYDRLYLLGGSGIRVFDPAADTYGEPVPYRPLVTVATSPSGVGTPLEEANLLGGLYRQSFTTDGESLTYKLFLDRLDSVDYVKMNGETLDPSAYTVNRTDGCVRFVSPPAASSDGLEIGFSKEDLSRKARVDNCRKAMVYGGDNDTAVFLWGNEDLPQLRFNSVNVNGVPSFEYFPESAYVCVGDGSPVTDIIRHYDRQIVFTRNAAYYSYPETYTDALGRDRTVYPVKALSTAYGNVSFGQSVLMDNDPVTVTPSGLCRWLSTSIRDEKNALIFSQSVSGFFSGTDPESLKLFMRRSGGTLLATTLKGDVLVYSPRINVFWIWRGIGPCRFFENGAGELFFGTYDGRICRMGGASDDGLPIEARWCSAPLELGEGNHSKTVWRLRADCTSGGGLKIDWTADTEGRNLPGHGKVGLRCGFGSFDFSNLDFFDFSFNTQDLIRRLKARVRIRRFRKLRVVISSVGREKTEIESLSFHGTVNDKYV
ncbi:MAG: hypothetical protein IJV00_08925 [Clostridia bacterium]|nr:hypothetical protein [Clostridia bacterium]